MKSTNESLSIALQDDAASSEPNRPVFLLEDEDEQKGKSTRAVSAMMSAPPKPAIVPASETPPFVPGGTRRREGEVISRGAERERMPSSEEKVSAQVAA
jgi:hypothetical protein